MKKIILSFFIGLSILACSSSDDNNTNNNPYLVTPAVNLNLSLNLPEYSELKFPNNSVVVTSQGIKGIVVYSINETLYSAFEISDPNHSPNSCSRMLVVTPVATCQCDDENKYNIITGEHTSQDNSNYPMLRYNAIREGDNIRIFN